jgi:hypothetical protein
LPFDPIQTNLSTPASDFSKALLITLRESERAPMFTRLIRRGGAAAVVLIAGSVAATPAFAGPPWISAEFPANPHEAATRGAFFLVHTYHHGMPMDYLPTGTAEGLVDGRRQSIKLEIVATGKTGVYAVRYRAASTGVWVLAINMGVPDHDGAAGMLVLVTRDGEMGKVEVPTTTAEGGRWIIPRAITRQDVESALRKETALRGVTRPQLGSRSVPGGVLLFGGLGLVFGIPLVRRFRIAR